ncbi:MAG: S8 family peptidase [Lachnospiraceae bacterium]
MLCKDTEAIVSNNYADYISDFTVPQELLQVGVSALDYCFMQVDHRYRIVYVNRSQIPQTNVIRDSYYGIPKLYGLESNEQFLNLIETGIYKVQNPPLSLTGKGVLLGFVDTGIRYREEFFINEFGKTKIASIWDQTIEGNAPENFFYGTEYTREEIDLALQSENPLEIVPSYDENGHGSAMASVQAAPDAELLVVKLKPAKQYLKGFYLLDSDTVAFEENDIMLGCKYLLDYANKVRKPLVICLGIGTNWGDHAGNSPLGVYLSDIHKTRSRAVVVSAGNEGNANHHYKGVVENVTDTNKVIDTVELRVQGAGKGFACEFWGMSPDVYEIGVITPGGEQIPRIKFNYQEGQSYDFVYEKTVLHIDMILVEQVSAQELIVIRFENPTNGVWQLQIYAKNPIYFGEFHLWLPTTTFLAGVCEFLNPNPYNTITEPGMAEGVTTVGAYNSVNNSFAFFSGRGFSRQGLPKPDMIAPGVMLETPVGITSGTSIAGAYVAGAMADFMQWAVVERNAVLVSGIEIEGYFIRGATREDGMEYPSRELGYGKINLAGVFESLRR